MVEIIPAILTDNAKDVLAKLKAARGVAPRVQIDIIDGEFADNKTVDPVALDNIEVADILAGEILLDYHLMVKEPVNWITKCMKGHADRIIGHVEMMADQKAFVGEVTKAGAKVGLAIDLDTPVSEIAQELLRDLDVVLVMSVKAGHGGQKFNKKALDKIEELAKIRAEGKFDYRIVDDGGVVLDTVDDVRREGADEVNVGNRIFKGNLRQNMRDYLKAAYEGEETDMNETLKSRQIIKNIAFFGDANLPEDDEDYQDAYEIAKTMASENYTVVDGGGPGIMVAATKGAEAADGETVAVTFDPTDAPGFEGRYVGNVTDTEIVTTNYVERMFKLMEHADLYIIFRGGSGTLSELGTAWVLAKLYYGHHKPFILYGKFWHEIVDAIHKNMNIDDQEMDTFKIVEKREDVLPTVHHFEHVMKNMDHSKDCKICDGSAFTR